MNQSPLDQAKLLLQSLSHQQIQLWVEQGKLLYKVPKAQKQRFTELLPQLKAYKPQLIELLSEPEKIVPLSHAQQRLWYLANNQQSQGLYNEFVAFEIAKPLDVERLADSLQQLAASHEALRTVFIDEGGVPSQKILADINIELKKIEPQQQVDLNLLFGQMREQVFDLSTGPLFRAAYIAKPNSTLLLFCAHHIVVDAWSMGLLLQNLANCYNGEPLSAGHFDYSDYVQEQQRQPNPFEQAEQYWADKLAHCPPTTPLPHDYQRSAKADFGGDTLTFKLNISVTRQLEGLAASHQASMFMLMSSALAVLLGRYSNHQDIVLGTLVAGRDDPRLESLVGFFVNLMPLRFDVDLDLSFEQFLQANKLLFVDGYEHAGLPFERMVKAANARSSGAHTPLFQVLLDFQNAPFALPSFDGGATEQVVFEPPQAKFDLTFAMVKTAEGLTIKLNYDRGLFAKQSIANMGENLLVLCESIAQNPQQGLGQLKLLAKAQQDHLLELAQGPKLKVEALTVVQRIERQVEQTPQLTAVVFEDQRLSYHQLNVAANQLAHYLLTLGVEQNQLVALCLPRGLDMIVAMLAVMKAGGAYLPLDPNQPLQRRQLIIEDAGASLLIGDSLELQDSVKQVIRPSECRGEVEQLAVDNPVGPKLDDLVYVLFTSGSTGVPKGVMINHRAVANFVATFTLAPQINTGLTANYVFDVSVFEIYCALTNGSSLYIPPVEVVVSPPAFAEFIARNQLNHVYINAMHIAPVAEHLADWVAAGKPLALKTITVGAEPIKTDSVRWYFDNGIQVSNNYGPTEATIFATGEPVEQQHMTAANSLLPIGRPLGNVNVYLFDSQMNFVPQGVSAQMFIGGGAVAKGYLNRPELSAERFIDNPWLPGEILYQTGDLAHYLANGHIQFDGRIDTQVKIHGHRIELAEIEVILARDPTIHGAVVEVSEQAGSKVLVAYLEADSTPDLNRLKTRLISLLPHYMVPHHYYWLGRIPLNSSGKVDRKALAHANAVKLTTKTTAQASHANLSANERILLDVWQQVLQRQDIDIHDNFFELGGDSILSFQVAAKAKEQGVAIEPQDSFLLPTIAELADAAKLIDGKAIKAQTSSGILTPGPIYAWWLKQNLAQPQHYNQSLMLHVDKAVEVSHLVAIVEHWLAHHPILRLQLDSQNQLVVASDYPDTLAQQSVSEYFLAELSPAQRQQQMAELSAQLQGAHSLSQGKLIKLGLFQLGCDQTYNQLFISIHHLAVDGVSWRVLLESLVTAFQHVSAGQPIPAQVYGSSLFDWTQRLAQYADSDAVQQQRGYWQHIDEQKLSCALPQDFYGASNRVGSSQQVVRRLSASQTDLLLGDIHRSFNTHCDEILLCALVLALKQCFGLNKMVIDLEYHGREALFDDIDVSRTVGWFTSLFPVLLEADDDVGGHIKQIKEQLRSVSSRGIGYGLLNYLNDEPNQLNAPVCFNYLGQFRQDFDQAPLFGMAEQQQLAMRSGEQQRQHMLEVGGLIKDGCLEMTWIYSELLHLPQTIENLAVEFELQLERIIELCLSLTVPMYTPSDFPLANLSQAAIDNCQAMEHVVDKLYPLSPTQAGIYFHSYYGGDHGTYSNLFQMSFKGHLNEEVLRRSWQMLMDNYEVLRAKVVRFDQQQPMLLVVPKGAELRWLTKDFSHLDIKDAQLRYDEFLAQERAREIDLNHAPYCRFGLVALGQQEFRLIWTFHQVLLDGWSIAILFEQLINVYNALLHHQSPQWPSIRPFSDYIDWLQQQDNQGSKDFWQQYLQGFSAPTRLTHDHLEQQQMSAQIAFDEVSCDLSESVTAALKTLAKHNQWSLNTLLQGAWAMLLRQYTNHTDVVFGCAVAGRPLALTGVDAMVGLFINTVPVRVKLAPEASVERLLQQVQSDFAASEPYRNNIALADIQRLSELAGGTGLFESLLVFENYPLDGDIRHINGQLQLLDVDVTERTNYPLTLFVIPAEQLTIKLSYHSNRFERDWAEQVLRHLSSLLEQMLEDIDKPVAEYSVICAKERQQLLFDFNATDKDYSFDAWLGQLIDGKKAATAVVCDQDSLSYLMLKIDTDVLAAKLLSLGVKPGDRVGVLLPRSIHLPLALLAVMKAGAVYVPLDPVYPAQRLAHIIDDAGISLMLTDSSLTDLFDNHKARPFCLDSQWKMNEIFDLQLPPVRLTDPAYIIYTSGTTGQPKGVVVSHRALLNFLFAMKDIFELQPEDKWLAVTTVSFDIAALELFLPLLCGAQVHIAQSDMTTDAPKLSHYIETQGISHMQATPSTWQLLLIHQWQGSVNLKILVGGEALPIRLGQTLCAKASEVWNLYGPTETTIWSSCYRVQPREGDDQLVAELIGRPIANTQIYILDETERLSPLGVAGQLCIAGLGLAQGYHNRPDLNAASFVEVSIADINTRLYKTGDLARYLPDGNIEILGRIDSQVKLRGYRIELGEIEQVLLQQQQVTEAAVVIKADSSNQHQQLLAYWVGKGAPALATKVKQQLPEYMCPAHFIQLDSLPRLPNGKLDRRSLAARPLRLVNQPKNQGFNGAKLEKQLLACWQQVLPGVAIGVNDNFFDIGGHSLLLAQVHHSLIERYPQLTMVDLFSYPTISELAKFLTVSKDVSSRAAMALQPREDKLNDQGVAIIGMAGRFPGADNLEQFWQNLSQGVESIVQLDQPQRSEGYIDRAAVLSDVAGFDANFFAMTPRNAALMDPQHRIFMETAWAAMEDACYPPASADNKVGVFAGCGASSYLLNNLQPHSQLLRRNGADYYEVFIQNDKDFLPTRTSYQLDLSGPSVAVQTACSTSLVAVHMAMESLARGECDMALAGGASVQVPHDIGYWYQPGMIFSPDGHCRAFDKLGQGTVPGNGVGVVLLKPLEAARLDGDHIYAVVKGSAINNDGAQKVGFTAPSKPKQSAAITMALQKAGVSAESISYVEAHGTATPLGDPIEIAALVEAFGDNVSRQSCALGAVKTNIGHCDTAAGIAGFIKTALSLKHKTLVPTLHFKTANPQLQLSESPFYVNTECKPWHQTMRRAGVSSFGVGGTNAHAILEQAPELAVTQASQKSPGQLLITLSAKTASALHKRKQALSNALEQQPQLSLADVAYSMNIGRMAMPYRAAYCFEDRTQLLKQLSDQTPGADQQADSARSVIFMFSGQGSQQAGMGRALYHSEPVFRQAMDQCAAIANKLLDDDLLAVMFDQDSEKLDQTQFTQPAVFAFGWSLVKLWQSWGVTPAGMIGMSLGELIAACVSGVMSLVDALHLVVARGALVQTLPPGAMLMVSMAEAQLLPLLPQDISLTGVNSPERCTVGGSVAAIAAFAERLTAEDIIFKRLNAHHAFHSHMLDPVLAQFKTKVEAISLHPPSLDFVSNITGQPITDAEAQDPQYWVDHLRQPVRFDLTTLLEQEDILLVEIGPDTTLNRLARQTVGPERFDRVISSVVRGDQSASLAPALAQLWRLGVDIDWRGFYQYQQRLRLSLPSYPFEHQRFWVEPPAPSSDSSASIAPIFQFEPAKESCALASPSQHRPATSAVEKQLVAIYTSLLGIEQIGLNDDLYLLGGDSLLAMRVVNQIKTTMGVTVPLVDFLSNPCIADVAQYISEQKAVENEISAIDRSGQLPLSYAQQRLWFLDQLNGPSTVYNMTGAIALQGELDVAALQSALTRVVERQEIIRSRFSNNKGKPELSFRQAQGFSLERMTIKELTPEAIASIGDKPFDLSADLLLRATLIAAQNSDQQALLLSIHHIISDGWSLQVLITEIIAAYQQLTIAAEPLQPLAFEFVDYVQWQSKQDVQPALEYWQNQLKDLPTLLDIATDHPRPAQAKYQGKTYHFELDSRLCVGLSQLAQQSGATLFMVLLSTFALLLKRYSGQDDIPIGTAVANRHHSDAEALIGFFVNTLVMRLNLTGDPKYSDLLAQTKTVANEAFAHQELPFEQLVEALNPPRSMSHAPLFQVMMVLQNTPQTPAFAQDKLQLELIQLPNNVSKFDLTLVLEANNSLDGMKGYFEYDSGLFKPQSIEFIAEQFKSLLDRICAAPKTHVAQLLRLNDREHKAMPVKRTPVITKAVQHPTLLQRFAEVVATGPDQIAIAYQDSTLSYKALAQQSDRLAAYLLAQGCRTGDVIGMFLPPSIEQAICFMGVLKAGCVYLPLDPAYPKARLDYMLNDAKIKRLISNRQLWRVKNTIALPSQLLIDIEVALAEPVELNQAISVSPDDRAYIIYTSGSTGKPKGVVNLHAGLANLAQYQQRLFAIDSDARILQFSSNSFDASIWEMVMALGCGARLHFAEREEILPGAGLQAFIKQQQISHITLPPSSLAMLTVEALPLDCVIVAGEACPRHLAERWSQVCRFFNAYGPTETTVCATVQQYRGGEVLIGEPVDNFSVYIVDEFCNQLPIGVPGELLIGGVGLAWGYLNQGQLTNEKFIDNPFAAGKLYRSGDRGRLVEVGDGEVAIEFLGRIDHQVKLRGFRVELGEIESLLARQAGVAESAVVVIGEGESARLAAHFSVIDNKSLTAQSLQNALSRLLPRHQVPTQWQAHPRLPKLPNGKIDRQQLQQLPLDTQKPKVAPRTALELQLQQLWQQVLQRQDIGVLDNFFELGGQSLLVVQLSARLGQVFAVDVPAATIFEYPTIETMASYIEQQDQGPAGLLVTISAVGEKPPIFALPGVGGHVIGFQPLAQALGQERPFYALQAKGLDGKTEPYTSVEQMAAGHIKELKAIQPTGPYWLVGQSFGGHVAYEISRQLQAQGQRVEHLVLLDIVAPTSQDKDRVQWNDKQWLTALVETIEHMTQIPLQLTAEQLEGINFDQQLILLAEILKRTHIMPFDSDIGWVRGALKVFKASWQMDYCPTGVVDTHALVFRSKILPPNADETTVARLKQQAMGWDEWVTRYTTHDIDGDHHALMRPPYVEAVAEIIEQTFESQEKH